MLAYSLRMGDGMKRCAKCGESKALEEFHRSVTNRDGRASRCKTCRNQDSRDYLFRRRQAEDSAEQRGRSLGIER